MRVAAICPIRPRAFESAPRGLETVPRGVDTIAEVSQPAGWFWRAPLPRLGHRMGPNHGTGGFHDREGGQGRLRSRAVAGVVALIFLA